MAVWGPDAPPREALLSYVIAPPRALRWYDVFLLPLGAFVFTALAGGAALLADRDIFRTGFDTWGMWVPDFEAAWFLYTVEIAFYAGFIATGVALLAFRGHRLSGTWFPRIRAGSVLAAVGVGAVFALSFMWALSMFPAETQQQLMEQSDLLSPSGGGEALMLAVVAVLLAPVAEELYFRGVLFRLLSARLSFVWSAGITALLFSLSHGHLFALPGLGGWMLTAMLFAVGFVLAAFAWVTGSLRAPAIMHGAYNAVMLGPSILFAFTGVPV
ncbi:MAG: CPBP family intramembrane glutamic endopeptidase [Parvibaculum sp.]|uniref:CPBP family intramembrane glutamic endopeptidase n=1 Tax=Parvibaculum sp. TaxID=2024848 RepID=UPI002ABB7BCF|nr:CPBP family intramembrane glutamic endopeptidase [Parvibaculum sp.]MDZ4379877.1 CPBP family intramembrane glutamic endopeptidase [Parvibaculum sp.]